jgi:hypothetical protein
MDLATIADDYDAMSCRISLIPFRLVVRHNILAPRQSPLCHCDRTRQFVTIRPSWRARAIARRPFKSSLFLTLRAPKLSRRGPEQPPEMTG